MSGLGRWLGQLQLPVRLAWFYAEVSPEGKYFLRELKRRLPPEERRVWQTAARDPAKRARLLHTFAVCDRVFGRQVRDFYRGRGAAELIAQYWRFIPFAWGMLEVRCHLFDAFAVAYDERAEERCALFALLHREWNDLVDDHGYTFAQLRKVVDEPEPAAPPLRLLQSLRRRLDALMPEERFPTYYRTMREYPHRANLVRRADNVREYVKQTSHYFTQLQTYLMVDRVPEALIEFLPPFAAWYYQLDELADLGQDRQTGKATFMGGLDDPLAEIEARYRDCEREARRLAAAPAPLLELMRLLTDKTILARRQGLDLEEYCFGAR